MNMVTQWFSDHALPVGLTLLIAIVAYYAGKIVFGRLIAQLVKGAHRHQQWHRKDIEKRQKTLVGLFGSVWRILIILVVVFTIFREIFPHIDLSPLFASAGIIGVALGFGAQSLIKDFLTGIFIITENQYRVGDVIDIDGSSGTVERVGTRSTVLRDVDGSVHYFPNGTIAHVINRTMGYSMARFSVSLDPATDIDKAMAIIDEQGLKLAGETKWQKKILEPPAFTSIGNFTAQSVEIQISGKTQPSDQWAVVAEMRRRLLREFEKQNINLA